MIICEILLKTDHFVIDNYQSNSGHSPLLNMFFNETFSDFHQKEAFFYKKRKIFSCT